MPRTALVGYKATPAGPDLGMQAPDVANGNSIPNWCKYLLVVNASGVAGANVITTLDTPGTFDGLAIANRTVTTAFGASDVVSLILLTPELDAGDGTFSVNFSTATGITVCPFA